MGKTAYQRIAGLVGNRLFADYQGLSTPGILQTIISLSVPATEIRVLHQLVLSCRMYGRFQVLDDGVVVASGNTGSGESNASFVWAGGRPIDANHLIEVKFLGDSGIPACTLDAYLQMTDAI